jgi:hypothetical protein
MSPKDQEALQYEREARFDAWLDSIEEPNDPNRDEWLEQMNQGD